MVSEGDKLLIEKLVVPAGEEFDFEEVLLVGNALPENAKIGQPLVEGAKVHAKVLSHQRAEKKIVFKYHSKTRQRKKKTHRQYFTELEIVSVK